MSLAGRSQGFRKKNKARRKARRREQCHIPGIGGRDQARGKRMTSANLPLAGIASSDIWKAARHLDLYARTDAQLEALIAQHREGDRVIAEAARYVRNLRHALSTGAV